MAPLRSRQIFDFYWPLVLTSQMMTLAAPIINMGLGRNEDAKIQLAAYAVGFGLVTFLNSPLFPLGQVVAALGDGPKSRRSVFLRGLALGAVLLVVQLIVALLPFGENAVAWLMGSTPAVSALSVRVILVLSPIAILIPIRSFFYGIIMRHRNTKIISLSTGLRLAVLATIIFGSLGLGHVPAAALAGLSLSIGILIETIYVAGRALRLVRMDAKGVNSGDGDAPLGWTAFIGFAGPLMINAMTWSFSRPLINAVLGRCSDPDLAQAGFGFVFPLLILSASPLWAFQPTSLVLVKSREDLRVLLRFGAWTILLFIVAIGAVVWTPLRELLVTQIFSLGPGMLAFTAPALILIPWEPVTLGLRTISHGFLMARKKTRMIGLASLVKIIVAGGVGFPFVLSNPDVNGAVLGTVLLMGAETVETAIIIWRVGREKD